MQNALCGFRAEDIAAICQVDLATARRWKAGTSRVPYAAVALVTGDLGAFSPYWKSWLIRGEEIVSPDGWTVRRNDALAVPLLHSQIAALRSELEQLKAVGAMEEQPAPGSVNYVLPKAPVV